MAKKIRAAALDRIRIHNSHNIAVTTGEKLYIGYIRGDKWSGARWSVIGIKVQTDPTAHWKDMGNKTFPVWTKEEKEEKLQEAKNWVKQKYGIDITEKDVWGGWHRTGTLNELRNLIRKEV
ncbi:MAG: hypothetical protein PHF95_05745 [bacterium]|nr:hypothetical protein [bacterium]